MKRTPASSSPLEASPPLEKGQMWQIGDITVHVTQVGKLLVHYKRYKVVKPGTPTALTSIRELQAYLNTNKAVMVPQQ